MGLLDQVGSYGILFDVGDVGVEIFCVADAVLVEAGGPDV